LVANPRFWGVNDVVPGRPEAEAELGVLTPRDSNHLVEAPEFSEDFSADPRVPCNQLSNGTISRHDMINDGLQVDVPADPALIGVDDGARHGCGSGPFERGL
jgi:hypothetical protein